VLDRYTLADLLRPGLATIKVTRGSANVLRKARSHST
jgi:hypothetical protein